MITWDLLQRLVDKYRIEKGRCPNIITYDRNMISMINDLYLPQFYQQPSILLFNGIRLHASVHPQIAPGYIYCGREVDLISNWVSLPVIIAQSFSVPLHEHIWKEYIGLIQRFEYCECGEKKNETRP